MAVRKSTQRQQNLTEVAIDHKIWRKFLLGLWYLESL